MRRLPTVHSINLANKRLNDSLLRQLLIPPQSPSKQLRLHSGDQTIAS